MKIPMLLVALICLTARMAHSAEVQLPPAPSAMGAFEHWNPELIKKIATNASDSALLNWASTSRFLNFLLQDELGKRRLLRKKRIERWMTAKINSDVLAYDAKHVLSMAFSPDEKSLAAGSENGTIRLWNIETRKLEKLTGHTRWVTSLAFSPDGRRLASGSGDKTVRLWDLDSKQSMVLEHTDIISAVAFSADGKQLASGSYSWRTGRCTIIFWNVETGRSIRVLKKRGPLESGLYSMAFSPDGKMLAYGGRASIRLLNLKTQKIKKLRTPDQDKVISLAFSPDGNLLASGSKHFSNVRLWDVATGELITELKGHTDWVKSLSFYGNLLASGSEDNTIRLWSLQTEGHRVLQVYGHPSNGHNDYNSFVAFSPDGRFLASSSEEGLIQLWYPIGQE